MPDLIQTTATPEIINFLHANGILAYNLLGAIEHVKDLILYTDNPTDPTGLMGKEDYFMYVVTKESRFIDAIMKQFCLEDGYYGFTGIDQKHADHILSHHVKCHWRNDCYLYYLPEDASIPASDTRVKSIPISALETINDHYEYQTDVSLDQIRDDILNRPSSMIEIDGDLAAWVIVHRDDTMGIMYTKEAYRKQGLAYLLCIDLMHKVRALGKTPYVQINTANTASPGLACKAGMIKAEPIVSWFGIVVGDLPLDD